LGPYSKNKEQFMVNCTRIAAWRLGTLCLLAFVVACSSSDSGGDDPNRGGDGLADSLDRLGVDTEETARQDTSGEELPQDFAPLGASKTVGQIDELVIVGPQILTGPTQEPLENRVIFTKLSSKDAEGTLSLTVTDTLDPGTIWETDNETPPPGPSSLTPQTRREVGAGDIDGDGIDEIIAVYKDGVDVSGVDQLWIEVIDDAGGTPQTLYAFDDVRDVGVETGDFDGDGVSELVLGLASSNVLRVVIFRVDGDGDWVVQTEIPFTPLDTTFNSRFSFELAAGALDRDNPEELVVILNEALPTPSGASRYWVFDDARTDFDPWAEGQLVQISEGGVSTGQVADVDLGDIDLDGLDEILIGGLYDMSRDACGTTSHLMIALDDGANPDARLATIGSLRKFDNYVETGTGCNENSHDMWVQKAFVNAFDVDGDDRDEVHVGRHVYSFADSSAPWTELYELPYDAIGDGTTQRGTISAATASIVSGDVSGNGREELVVFLQFRDEVSVWGLVGPDPATAEWGRAFTIPTVFYNSQSRVFPVLVPANLDKDGVALKYSEGEYRFFFSAPIVIAALAAAPCDPNLSQNIAACVTSYGTSESSEGGIDGTVTVTASAWVGGKAEIFGQGVEAKAKVTASASYSAGRFYSLEETVEFTTGPIEDTVVFTTLPVDQYTYTVIAHPDPSLEGEQVVINLPRSPITLQVERGFYNESTLDDALKIESNVFQHTPGEIDTYPTEESADALISTGGIIRVIGGELVDAVGIPADPELVGRLLGDGLKTTRPTTVGQGTGQTSTEIRFTETETYRAGASIGFELEAETTAAGVTLGGSVGASAEAGLSWGGSNSTIYRGTVGSIGAANFSENVYNFGLFTYVYNFGDETKPQFEVINYWVERVE
jgi:hypothetical protein